MFAVKGPTDSQSDAARATTDTARNAWIVPLTRVAGALVSTSDPADTSTDITWVRLVARLVPGDQGHPVSLSDEWIAEGRNRVTI